MTREVTCTNRGKNQKLSDLSEDNESSTYQETDQHDNSNVISLETETNRERFDNTADYNLFLEGSRAEY